jgi:PmbA protein
METKDFESSFGKIETAAKSDGVEVELLIERSESFRTGFQKGRPEKFDSATNQCAGFRVIKDGFEGYAFSEDLSDHGLTMAYRDALSNAIFAARGKSGDVVAGESLVPAAELVRETSEVKEMAELYSDSVAKLSIEAKLERGRLLEEAAKAFDPRIVSVPYNGYSEFEGETQILTSTGMRRKQRYSGVSGYAYCLAKGEGHPVMGAESFFTRNSEEFVAENIARKAAETALGKIGASAPQTGRYPVVIDHEVFESLLGLISGYFSAKAVSEKSSIFGRDLGKVVGSSKLTMVDDPFYHGGQGSRAFDGEGVRAKKNPIVENGTLKTFLTNSVYARRMNLPHTASASRGAKSDLDIGISNLIVSPGTKTLAEMLSSSPKLIYLTDLKGYHAGFKFETGDFSLQAEGELWENGQKVRPLCEFVVSGNIRELLMGIEELGHELHRPKSSVVAPHVLIRELSIAGK